MIDVSEDSESGDIRVVKIQRHEPETLDRIFADHWYSAQYGERIQSGKSPIEHYVEDGWRDGLMPNPFFDPKWYFETQMKGLKFTNPLVHYCEEGARKMLPFNCVVDPHYLRMHNCDKYQTSALRLVLVNEDLDQLSSWFSRKKYFEINPDIDPDKHYAEMHYFMEGVASGRLVAPGIRAELKGTRSIQPARNAGVFERVISKLTHGGNEYVVVEKVISESIRQQIASQASIEPDVASVGHLAAPYVTQFTATEINRRNLIDYRNLLRDIPIDCDAIVVLPAIQMGGAERYAANLAWGLQNAGIQRILLLTTDSDPMEDRRMLNLGIFSKLSGVHVSSIKVNLQGSWQQDTILALMLQRTNAKHLFVINSDLGLRVVRDFGKALSTRMALYCAFFSESPNAVGAPYSVRYISELLPRATILSDNHVALQTWNDRYNSVLDGKYACVPTLIDGVSPRVFESTARAIVAARAETAMKALWFSRWEKFKAVDVLQEIAGSLDKLQIFAYGSTDHSFVKEKLPHNLEHFGVMPDINDLRLDDFGIFLFTSYFEGLPNVVLEMAYRGIPVVASDVGGLRETFQSDEIEFVDMHGTVEEVSERFASAIGKIWALSDDELLTRLCDARRAVEARHGTDEFVGNIARLVGAR